MVTEFENRFSPKHIAPAISIVLPSYEEEANLRLLIPRLGAVMSKMDCIYEIIVVDDDSKDGTSELLDTLNRQGYPVRLITRTNERGLSSAVIRGFQEAHGDVLLCMDADMSHPPEVIPQMFDCFKDPAVDFVLGSRYVKGGNIYRGWSLLRWLNSKVASLMARPFVSVKDSMSGFFALKRSVFLHAATLNPVGYKIGLELMVKCGCRGVCEVPIFFTSRMYGKSKLNLAERINYLRHIDRLAEFKYGDAFRFAKFCMVGATGVFVDLSIFAILMKISVFSLLARGVAIWCAMTWNFFVNRRFTFSYSRGEKMLSQYVRFVVSCALGAFVNWSVFTFLTVYVYVFDKHKLWGAVLGIGAGALVNFVMARYWAFTVFEQGQNEEKEKQL